ncbi:MAG: cisplatin damage response ATP-dependent DNA ligase, partial [Planctomycetota bacterium]
AFFNTSASRRLNSSALLLSTLHFTPGGRTDSKSAIVSSTAAATSMGDWEPTESFFNELTNTELGESNISKPYPFFLANPLKEEPASLGEFGDWVAEWKWDGIRAQLICREGEVFIWSRGEELVTDQFPEVAKAAEALPDGTVLDGELLGWDDQQQKPLEFNQLQRRLGRKKVGKKLLAEVPIALLSFDVMEWKGEDIRNEPLSVRLQVLDKLLVTIGESAIKKPPLVNAEQWSEAAEARNQSKQLRAEGLMLKRRESTYQVGRPVGDWWKWKVDPLLIDAVLIYAQRGHGRRASLYTDYTFAVWNEDELVPFAKAYSGLTDAEIRKVDAFVRKNTKERFGPVRSVTPQLVFELAFENIQKSTRHKSGVAVRFPRINRWRHDKKPLDADRLSTILEMIDP